MSTDKHIRNVSGLSILDDILYQNTTYTSQFRSNHFLLPQNVSENFEEHNFNKVKASSCAKLKENYYPFKANMKDNKEFRLVQEDVSGEKSFGNRINKNIQNYYLVNKKW